MLRPANRSADRAPLIRLRRLAPEQVAALNMESVAVLTASPDSFARWPFVPGGDDFDDFEGAVLQGAALGPFGILRYQGQPDGTLSIVAPHNSPAARIDRLLAFLLKAGGLNERDVQWSLNPLHKGQTVRTPRTRRIRMLPRSQGQSKVAG
jgi:hypothetical protein